MKVAVIAHAGKQLGAGLGDLRQALFDSGITDPTWIEVPKSRKAPKQLGRALLDRPDVLFVWGGDGMVQRCIDTVATSDADVAVAIVPAGTGNLLAANLGIPRDIAACVKIGLNGGRRRLDVGKVNGERFAVMAGVGFDALMSRDTSTRLKRHIGRAAYIVAGAQHLGDTNRARTRVEVDGKKWFKGRIGCVLVGNVGSLFGGVTVFADAQPDDGRLEVGVVTAKGALQWIRALGRTAAGTPERSPFVELTSGRKIDIRLDRRVAYELDGGVRPATKRLKIQVIPAAVTVCIAAEDVPS
jgi:diacylglycerol kinase (ATP)